MNEIGRWNHATSRQSSPESEVTRARPALDESARAVPRASYVATSERNNDIASSVGSWNGRWPVRIEREAGEVDYEALHRFLFDDSPLAEAVAPAPVDVPIPQASSRSSGHAPTHGSPWIVPTPPHAVAAFHGQRAFRAQQARSVETAPAFKPTLAFFLSVLATLTALVVIVAAIQFARSEESTRPGNRASAGPAEPVAKKKPLAATAAAAPAKAATASDKTVEQMLAELGAEQLRR